MTIRFTEGFGIYGTGNIAPKLLDKWTSRTGTGVAWTVAEVNAAEFGPKIVT